MSTTRPTSRTDVLDSTLGMLQGGESISLESAARAAGLTKPGLMYHFPTKEALMLALVDHVVDRCEQAIVSRIGDPASATPRERAAAYATWSIEGPHDASELVVFADPRLRDELVAKWGERLRPYIELPDDLAPDVRARLLAVRLLADGAWFACASGLFPPVGDDLARLKGTVDDLLGGIE
ncbi:TetR/AcrR family transcriptional regulator [Leifsonia sp. NPDC058194]|uniref:TetR/AcrR family transcriptional regulator n=1 Tax=Leifsonia sp. NPDC058194 TaxID=3346374 RepID=UPI0036DDAE69